MTGYREDYNDDAEILRLRQQNKILKEALYDIKIACQEDFPDDEITCKKCRKYLQLDIK